MTILKGDLRNSNKMMRSYWLLTCLVWIGFGYRVYNLTESTRDLANGLSPVSDPYSEADALRAGQGFAEKGFLADSALPDILFGHRFPGQGSVQINPSLAHKIYTHYPPGPYWLAGISTQVFGINEVGRYRIFPILVSIFCVAYLFLNLLKILPLAGPWVCFLLLGIPMLFNMAQGLHYQGLALALLILQLALHLNISPKNIHRNMIVLAMLGFLQGLLSLDYVFLVSLAGWALYPSLNTPKLSAQYRRKLMFSCLLPMIFFGIALLLHFIQVINYWGSLQLASQDFYASAVERADLYAPHNRSLAVWWEYFYQLIHRDLFFSSLFIWLLVAFLFMLTEKKHLPRAYFFVGCGVGLLGSSLWIFAMPQHAEVHVTFIPRHFFLFFFVALFYTAKEWEALLPQFFSRLKSSPISPKFKGTEKSTHSGT